MKSREAYGRRSRFHRHQGDLEIMTDAAVNPLKAGLEDVVVSPSEICFIDGHKGRLIYRGYDVDDLVAHSTFEEVTFLLWQGRLPTRKELDAHLKALDYLRRGGESTTLNCGYGRGYSVRELLDMVEKVAGHGIAKREEPRRAGDPPTLVAKANRIRATLGWQPRHDDLRTIVATSLEWEKKLARGHWSS